MKKSMLWALIAAMLLAAPAAYADEETKEESSASSSSSGSSESSGKSSKLTLKEPKGTKHGRPLTLDVTVGANWWYVGPSLWLDIPIVPNGFAPALNDSFEIEVGTTLGLWYGDYGYSTAYYQSIMGGVRYSLYLTKAWTVYIRTLFGVRFWAARSYNGHSAADFDWETSIGAYWNFSKAAAMRFDLGYHGLHVGISFRFGNIGGGK